MDTDVPRWRLRPAVSTESGGGWYSRTVRVRGHGPRFASAEGEGVGDGGSKDDVSDSERTMKATDAPTDATRWSEEVLGWIDG